MAKLPAKRTETRGARKRAAVVLHDFEPGPQGTNKKIRTFFAYREANNYLQLYRRTKKMAFAALAWKALRAHKILIPDELLILMDLIADDVAKGAPKKIQKTQQILQHIALAKRLQISWKSSSQSTTPNNEQLDDAGMADIYREAEQIFKLKKGSAKVIFSRETPKGLKRQPRKGRSYITPSGGTELEKAMRRAHK